MSNKKLLFLPLGAPKIDPKHQRVIEASLPEILQKIRYFPLPSAYDHKKLDLANKFIMNFAPRMALLFRYWFKRDQKAKKQLAVFCKEQN